LYRASEAAPFKEVMRNDFETAFIPMGFVKGSNTNIYALSNDNRDKLSLVEYDAVNGKEVRNIYEDKLGDLNFEGYSSIRQEVLYTSSFVNRNQKNVLNPTLKEVYA